MPKTKDAFALRDFDKKRILQRPFFKKIREDYHVGENKSDEEILQDLSLANNDSLVTLERKHKVLNEIFNQLSRLRNLAINHSNKRLEKYRKAIQNKIETSPNSESLQRRYKREQSLATNYILAIPIHIADLMELVEKIWHELENRLQESYRENFAERLKQARLKANLSRKELGDTINLSPNGYGQYESARREPSLTSLIRLSRTLNVSADWLIGTTP